MAIDLDQTVLIKEEGSEDLSQIRLDFVAGAATLQAAQQGPRRMRSCPIKRTATTIDLKLNKINELHKNRI
jgi:hypothetical protein